MTNDNTPTHDATRREQSRFAAGAVGAPASIDEHRPQNLTLPITMVDDPEQLTLPGIAAQEYTGGSVSYYQVKITAPTSGGDAYTAECNDIIEALGMNYAEGNAFKAIWRRCAARNLGRSKRGYKDGLYDAEKVVFFGERMVAQEKAR